MFETTPNPDTEIVIERLRSDDDGNLIATLVIPVKNRSAYKLFVETFFERQVKDALVRFRGPTIDMPPERQ